MVSLPDAPGSGNSLTPLLRMHSANFTAFWALAVLLLPSPLPVPVPVSAGALEPHALISPTAAIRVRAAVGGRILFMCSPVGSECVDISSAPRRHWDRATADGPVCQRLLLGRPRRAR